MLIMFVLCLLESEGEWRAGGAGEEKVLEACVIKVHTAVGQPARRQQQEGVLLI